MKLYQILGVSVLGLFLCYTTADAECQASDTKIDACVKVYVTANSNAKNNTACLKDQLKGKCFAFNIFKTCLNVGEDATSSAECKTKISKELKDEGIACTYDEVVKATMCGASGLTFNLALFVITALLAIVKF
ncbi:uncharacterized protein [Haliotis cracherodii]|uniref:uncharacterized protein n=1 Tax=Haliotis cracherodii TaxID=6455 RepID=UPI0039ED3ECE